MPGLSREQLAFFVQHGYLVLRPTVTAGAELHNAVFDGACRLEVEELGNNCLPLLPELRAVLSSAEFRGALETLLGSDYVLMPHRHCHVQDMGSPAQPFHRDSYFSFEQFRHFLPMEIMVNYYPQRVLPQMGPTALLPGSQYHRGTRFLGAMEFRPGSWGDALEEECMTTEEPGTCVVMHYHLWHRATLRHSGGPLPDLPPRWMFKLQFRRVRPFRTEDVPVPLFTQPYPADCNGSSLHNLPVPLQGVKADSHPAWMERHAPVWAAVWAALAGEAWPWHSPVEEEASLDAKEGRRDHAEPEERVITLPLETLAARLASADTPVAQRFEAAHGIMLGSACAAWTTEVAVAAVLPVLQQPRQAQQAPTPEEDVAADRWGGDEARALCTWLGHCRTVPDEHLVASDPRWFAAAALQGLSTPLPPKHPDGAALRELVVSALSSGGEEVELFVGDWRLEALLALAAALPPEEAVPVLAPLVTLREPRVQLHAAMALYSAAVRCGAPAHGPWRAAAEAAKLETLLLEGVHFWVADFAPAARARLLQELKRRRREGSEEKVRGSLQPHDGGGRYALAEMLRCLGRFGSYEVALRAADLAGADAEQLCSGDEEAWRERFVSFVESQWFCPITSSHSPF